MEYQSAMRRNKTMPFAATWMQPEIIKQSELSQKNKDKYIWYYLYWYYLLLKYSTNEPIYETEADSQT